MGKSRDVLKRMGMVCSSEDSSLDSGDSICRSPSSPSEQVKEVGSRWSGSCTAWTNPCGWASVTWAVLVDDEEASVWARLPAITSRRLPDTVTVTSSGEKPWVSRVRDTSLCLFCSVLVLKSLEKDLWPSRHWKNPSVSSFSMLSLISFLRFWVIWALRWRKSSLKLERATLRLGHKKWEFAKKGHPWRDSRQKTFLSSVCLGGVVLRACLCSQKSDLLASGLSSLYISPTGVKNLPPWSFYTSEIMHKNLKLQVNRTSKTLIWL